jgi:hypothetical protein
LLAAREDARASKSALRWEVIMVVGKSVEISAKEVL